MFTSLKAGFRQCVRAIQNWWGSLIGRPERLTAISTFAIFVATSVASVVGIAQCRVLSRTLNEMRDEQRPWVYADLSSGGKIFRNQSGGLTIPIGLTFHNIGRLPAMYVSPDIEGYLSGSRG